MKDLIDLGNLVFNQLIKEHGEIEESRLLFIYGVTTGTQWSVLKQVDLKLARMRAEYDRPQPKDGDMIEFWSGESNFREIKF